MSAEYVAGSLSALFGKKPPKSDDVPVKLKHVKQMYEEFTPMKRPREVGTRQETPNKKRKAVGDEPVAESKPKKAKKSSVKQRVKDDTAEAVKENLDVDPSDNPDGDELGDEGELTNKQAALKRIKRKASLKEKQEKEAKGTRQSNLHTFSRTCPHLTIRLVSLTACDVRCESLSNQLSYFFQRKRSEIFVTTRTTPPTSLRQSS